MKRHIEVVRRSKFFTIKDGKLRRLEKKGSTRECISGDQIKQWIMKMHINQQTHLDADQTWFRIKKGHRWWPTIGICETQTFIRYDCPTCKEQLQNKPRNIICGSIVAQSPDHKDWRRLLMEYLTYGYRKGPYISKGQHKRITRQSREYFIEEGKLKRTLSNGDIKICISGPEVNKYLQEIHVTKSGEHLGIEVM